MLLAVKAPHCVLADKILKCFKRTKGGNVLKALKSSGDTIVDVMVMV